jgi:5-formaminoimidazole-4-carboxamide-1-beta-D-ribofuranosyl 5'-monophosphate synthetase
MDTKDLSKVQKDREEKLIKLRKAGYRFPNNFDKKDQISHIIKKYDSEKKRKSRKSQMYSTDRR